MDVMDYDNLINKLAWVAAKRSGIEFEEAQAQARAIAVDVARKHDPQKSGASTWLWHCVHNNLLSWAVKECRGSRHESLEDLLCEPSTQLTPLHSLSLRDDIATLSSEAQEVCRIVLDRPAEAALSGDATKYQAKLTLKRHLIRRGWARRTIEQAFSEISELLRQRM
jgi:DNA-directed RNA polymerase specialized sigma24 family protein